MASRTCLWIALWAACSQARFFERNGFNSSSSSATTTSEVSPSDTASVSSTTLTSPSLSSQLTITTAITPTPRTTSSASSNATTTFVSTPTTFDGGSNSTSSSRNGTTAGPCTGCVLEAYRPITTSFVPGTLNWTSVVVTETILNKTISYFTGTPPVLETVVTEFETINQTKTIVLSNQTVSYTAPFFTIEPTPGVGITVPVGPTYVIYRSLYGGLDFGGPSKTAEEPKPTESGMLTDDWRTFTCTKAINWLTGIAPTASSEWSHYIQTITSGQAAEPSVWDKPYSLPPALVQHLKNDPDAQAVFSGSDLATCTVEPTRGLLTTTTAVATPTAEPTRTRPSRLPPGPPSEGPPATEPATEPVFTTIPIPEQPPPSTGVVGPPTTETYISTTYQTTSTHITVRGCLRCEPTVEPILPPTNPKNPGKPTDGPSNPSNEPPNDPPSNPPNNPPNNPSNNPSNNPQNNPQNNPPDNKGRVTIGTDVYEAQPARPTQGNPNSPTQPNPPNQPNQPNQNPPNSNNKPTGVIIGTNTFTFGQTTTWNGVPVVIPSSGGGSTILVGGTSVAVNPAVTAPPVLTVGSQTITANPQGQFVVGSETIAPGKPAVTIDGTTLQIGPSGSIAIINGQTQTLGHAPVATNGPAITVNGQIFSASVIGGTTVFAVGSQTLTPGGVLVQDGTTFSLPVSGDGSTVIVNGVTSTLAAPGLPVLTVGSQGSQSAVTASVQGGTTAFVLGPGQTLTPGGVLTISGTTYSLPASASGSVVVINGETSTLGQGPITAAAALTIDGKTYSATVRDGTTEFVLGQGTTLKPGDSVVVSGTTYSLDPKGTALVIDGKTSTIPKTPASNSASTTASSSNSKSTSSSSSSSTTSRDPGEFIASGLGITSSKAGAGSLHEGGFDRVVEGAIMGIAGWLLMFL